MIRLWWKVAFVLALTATCGGSLAAQSSPVSDDPSSAAADETPRLEAIWSKVFVELSSPPTADGSSLSTVRGEKTAFRSAASRAGLRYKERYAFDVLWNGLSIEISPTQLGKLTQIDGVKRVYPVVDVAAPEPRGGESAELYTALGMTGADVAQDTLGLTGTGIKVAVMDTGLDYDHEALGGDGVQRTNSSVFPTSRVVTGYDFVGDGYNSSGNAAAQVPHPDAYPDDCAGHGTHVAGIVGANGGVNGLHGVAPGVTFGAYRVFGCSGTTSADIMIAAMERVLADRMQILNMSIGSAYQWPQYPTAQASDRLVNRGVVVVASAGNEGANGLYASSAPSIGDKVIGAASFDNSQVNLRTFTVTPAGLTIGYTNATGAPAAPLSGSLPLAKSGTPSSTADACNVGGVSPFSPGQFSGMAVLIRRGTCGFYEKSRNAELAGAAAVVLYNNAAGRVSPTVAGDPPITIPVVAVSDTEGVAINNAINSGPQTLNWQSTFASFPVATAGLISSFSSFGVTAELGLKPDIGAPGGYIFSTYPLELGGYASLSGTSMAAPHTAGAVALLLQARPSTPAQAVRTILQNSADPHLWWGNPGLGFLDNTHRQGAGMLDIPGAIQGTTQIDPGKLSLGESQAGPATRTLTLRNYGGTAVTYDLSHTPALSTGPNTFTPSFLTGFASVSFSVLGVPVSSITVPGGGTASVDVTVAANSALPDKSLYGGYVVFTPQGGGQTYRVPYAGFKGDYQSIVVLTPTANGFPWLAKLVGSNFIKQSAGATYTFASGDIPYFLVHADHQSRRLRVEIFEAVSGKSWHEAMDFEYLGRNATATGFYALAWDGTTAAGKNNYTIPDGQYVAKMSVLKALGDPANPADWEYWTSPAFNVDRP